MTSQTLIVLKYVNIVTLLEYQDLTTFPLFKDSFEKSLLVTNAYDITLTI